jgi:hypothetical protein
MPLAGPPRKGEDRGIVNHVSVALIVGCCALPEVMALRAAQVQLPQTTSSERRAIAYLTREVPAWRREHPCYSCHNNGDAARALIAALGNAPEVREALKDTLTWLADPGRWESNGGGEGGADDKQLARIQFAHATTAAFAAALVPKTAVDAAATIVAADQLPDGSWRLDSSDSLGSPATYGTALATAFARRTLAASRLPAFDERIARAERWLGRAEVSNVPDAAAILVAFADSSVTRVPDNWRAALDLLKKGQGRDGGWGPYLTSPAEPFDTAIATLALYGLTRRASRAEPTFTRTSLTDAIANGRAHLIRQQLADGTWNETTRPPGQTSYAQRVSTTAWVLLALLETRGSP